MLVALEPLRDGWIVAGYLLAPVEAEKIAVAISIDGRPVGVATANVHQGIDAQTQLQRLGFEFVPPFELCDGREHLIEALVGEDAGRLSSRFVQHKPYTDTESFLAWAYYHRLMTAPFNEIDKICLGNFDLLASHWAAKQGDCPLVSVVMPVFNRPQQVVHAIESVRAQRYIHWQLIIVDDGSAAPLDDLVARNADPRITLVRSEMNQGQAAARNRALQQARGKYVAYLDSDNTWDARYLAVMVRSLETYSAWDVAYCGQYLHRDGDPRPIGVRIGPYNSTLIENQNYLDINCIVHRRALLAERGLFDATLRALEDWEFVLRLTSERAPLFVPVVLMSYCVNSPDAVGAATNEAWQSVKAARRSGGALIEASVGEERLEIVGAARKKGAAVPVSVMIPSYRIPSILRLCVERVFATTDCEVIVCDNGSDAATQQELGRLQAEYPTLRIDRAEQNYGFTHAVNRGLRMAAAENHVVILNNDAIVADGWLDALLDVVEREPDVGIVAPQQILLPGTHTISNHAPYATPHAEIDVNLSAHHRNVIASAPARVDRITALSFVPFFCVLLTRRARGVVDQLSEELGPHYRSDSHACFVIRTIAGLQILHTPYARVYHLLQRSTRELRSTDSGGYRQMLEANVGTREEAARPLWERTSA